jgi:citrate/tricarballylate utilization protein
MGSLEELTRQARELAEGGVHLSPEADAARQLQICNACRYCEGFCAVFPAMTRRLEFASADTHFLANLCHNCGACLHACQYAPPHEFAVNIPRAMARVRVASYSRYAWPGALAGLYQRNSLSFVLTLTLLLTLALRTLGMQAPSPGANFYDLMAHNTLVAIFGPVFGLAVFAMGVALVRCARDMRRVTTGAQVAGQDVALATQNALTLRYLDGGHGQGCNNTDDAYSHARRHAHHLTFYGFVLCFAATSVATLYHYLWGLSAPYDLPSLPKFLGAVGGVMLCLGTASQMALKLRRHPLQGDAAQNATDHGFMALLFVIGASGLWLWAWRTHPQLVWVLALHLGAVMALFLTLPYGKMVHGFFRWLALARHAVEQRQPNSLGLGSD